MNNSNIDSILHLCRLCTNYNDVSSTLKKLSSDNIMLIEKLNTIVPGILEMNKDLPNGICTKCIVQLNDCYKFVKSCFKSQKTLQKYLKRIDNRKVLEDDNIHQIENSEIKIEDHNILDCKNSIINNNEIKLEIINEENTGTFCNFLTTEFIKKEENFETEENEIKLEEVNLSFDKNEQIICDSEIKTSLCDSKIISEECDDYKSIEFVPVEENCELGRFCEENLEIETTEQNSNKLADVNMKINEVFVVSSLVNIPIDKKKRYQCTTCEKGFDKKFSFIRHFCNANRKPKCDLCGKVFSAKCTSYLKEHMRTHTNERPFQCKICEKSFTRSGNLRKHTRIHSNIKPHKCQICEKAFIDTSNLKVHIRRHHP